MTARLHPALSSAGILALLTLALFGDVLLGGASAVLSGEGTDIVTYFLPLREFGFRELRAGSFPLWDPYTYSGTPYAANFQAALFYPPSWLHLVAPAPTAFNAIFALHWFLAAWFTALWRFLHAAYGNFGLLRGVSDANGYDPITLARYARFLAVSQGIDPATVDWAPSITSVSPLFEMLRVRHVFYVTDRARVTTLPDPMPRLGLIRDWRVVSPDEALGAMARHDFDPRRTVLLETPPDPAPSPGPSGGVARVLRSTTDELEIEADLAAPAILLVTDPWAEGWRVTPLSPGPQPAYRLQPADYVLRAVPLAAGRHHLLLHYEQSGLLLGAVLSLTSLVGLVAAAFAVRRGR